jgi:two-component system, NtrC family, response regulator AtoC
VTREGFAVESAATLKEARATLAASGADILLLDIQLPDGTGLDLLNNLEPGPRPEVVLITGEATLETAVEALRLGVIDYLTKPVDFARLEMVLANLARTLELKGEIGSLRSELRRLGRFGLLVGGSPPMQKVYDLIGRVAPTDASVLLTGETGTGKEVVAQTIHNLSRRSKAPFLAVDCGALSATLIETELFGHERGSFTGADKQHRGHFERAHRGTLFLDEITEMPLELQSKLLRVLESRSVRRVGGTDAIPVDVRIIAATNRRPEEAVAGGKLREDLLYRLNVFPIPLPPLRERGDDVERLAEHFLAELNKSADTPRLLTKGTRERLRKHDWPGNIRELRNAVQRAFILAEGEAGVDILPVSTAQEGGGGQATTPGVVMPRGTTIAAAERLLILAALEHCHGDKKQAAASLKISLKTLYSRLKEYQSQGHTRADSP